MTTALYILTLICFIAIILAYRVDMAKVNEDRRQARQAERGRYYKWLNNTLR